MSDYADGSVYIETGLDTEGFRRGSSKMVSAMDNLAQRIENLCVTMERAFTGAASNLHNVGAAASRAAGDVDNATRQTEQSTRRASGSAEAYSRAMDGARASAQNMAGGQNEVDKAISQTEAKLQRLYEKQAKLKAFGADQSSARWQKLQQDIDKTTERINFYKKGLQEAEAYLREMQSDEARAEAHAGGIDAWEEYQDGLAYAKREVEENREEIEKLEAALEKLLEKQEQLRQSGADLGTHSWQSNQYDIDITEAKLEELLARKEELGEPIAGGFTIDVNRLAKSIDGLMDKLAAAGQRAFQFVGKLNATAVNAFANALKSAATHAMSLARSLGRIAWSAISKGINKASSSLKKFSSQTKKTSLDSNALVKSLSSIKRLLITRIKRTFISSLFKDVTEGIQRLAKFSDEFDKTMSRIKNSSTRLKGDIAVAVGSILTALEPVILKIINLLDRAVTALNKFFALLGGKSTYTRAKQGTDDYAKSTDKAAGAQKKLNAELYDFDELNRQSDKNSGGGGGDDGTGIQYEEVPIDLPQGVQDWIKRLKEAWQSGDWYGVGAVLAEGLNKALEVADSWINNKFRPWAVKWASRIGQIINGFVDNFNWELLGKTVADGINAVFDTLETFLDTVNWLNLGKGIGRAIKSWFDNIDWPMIGRVFAKKWNALINVIKGIVTTPGIWESIGKSIGQFIKAWFETIDFNAITDTIIGILKGIPEAINAFLRQDPFKGVPERIFSAINRVIHEVDWEELAGTLTDLFLYCIDQLRQIVDGINWPAVLENLRNMAVTVTEKLIEWFSSIDWGYVAEMFAIGFNQLIGAIGDIVSQPGLWEGIGTKISEVVKTWFATIDLNAVVDVIIKMLNGLTTMLKAFLDGDPFNGVVDKISSAINRLLYEVDWAGLFTTLGQLFMKLLGVFLDVVNRIDWHAVGAAIGDFLGSINWLEVLTKVGSAIFSAFSGIISGLFSTGSGRVFMLLFAAVKGLGMAFTAAQGVVALNVAKFLASSILGPVTTSLGTTLPAAITAAGPAILGALGVVATGVLDAVAGYTAKLGADLIFAQQELGQTLNNEVDTAVNSIVKCYESGGQETVAKWMEMAYGVKSTGEGMEADLRALAERIAQLQGKNVDEVYAKLRSGLADIESTTSAGMSNLHSTTDRGMNQVKTDITENVREAGAEVKRQNWNDVGDNVTKGIGRGIQNGWSWLQNTVRNLANNLLNAAKSALGIASPSKLFEQQVGENTGLGWARGIENTKGDVLKTVSNVADAIVNEADGVQINAKASGMMDGVETAVGGMQAVLSGLSNIAATFQSIADVLAGIGGFAMPQIAAGTIAPYKTKAAAESAPVDDSSDVEGHLTGIESALARLIEILQGGGNDRQDIKIIIDGREVFNVVVNENNRAIQRTGASPIRV